jgi:hypothetical protein
MTEQELQERYLTARQHLLEVMFWGTDNLLEVDHIRAAALAITLEYTKMDVQAVINLDKNNACIRFDIEELGGTRTTMLEIPVAIKQGD